jgi:hypothetical protein
MLERGTVPSASTDVKESEPLHCWQECQIPGIYPRETKVYFCSNARSCFIHNNSTQKTTQLSPNWYTPEAVPVCVVARSRDTGITHAHVLDFPDIN